MQILALALVSSAVRCGSVRVQNDNDDVDVMSQHVSLQYPALGQCNGAISSLNNFSCLAGFAIRFDNDPETQNVWFYQHTTLEACFDRCNGHDTCKAFTYRWHPKQNKALCQMKGKVHLAGYNSNVYTTRPEADCPQYEGRESSEHAGSWCKFPSSQIQGNDMIFNNATFVIEYNQTGMFEELCLKACSETDKCVGVVDHWDWPEKTCALYINHGNSSQEPDVTDPHPMVTYVKDATINATRKSNATACPPGEEMDNIQDCLAASHTLGIPFQSNLKHLTKRPAGCYWLWVEALNGPQLRFNVADKNEIATWNSNSFGPVCRQ